MNMKIVCICAIILGFAKADTMTACFRTRAQLNCASGAILKVTKADFSKPDEEGTCGELTPHSPCTNDITKDVQGMCDDLQSCKFRVSRRGLGTGDCGNKMEADLYIEYTCEQVVTNPNGYRVFGDVDQDCRGSDIGAVADASIEQCREVCNSNSNCVGFVYYTNDLGKPTCYPKWKLCFIPSAKTGTVVWEKIKRAPSVNDAYVFGYETMLSSGHDCYGKDITHHDVSTKEECGQKCDETEGCVGFVWSENEVASHPCWPKYELCHVPVPMALTAVFKKVPVNERSPRGFQMLDGYGKECPGSDLSNHEVSLEECGRLCQQESQKCTGFTYSYDRNRCWIKYCLCNSPNDFPEGSTFIWEDPVPPVEAVELDNYSVMDLAGDCPGKNIQGVNLSFEECASRCDELGNCVGFVYSTNGVASKPCWLKHGLCDDPKPMIYTGTFRKN